MADSTQQPFQFPNFNLPGFPYANLPAQAAAAFSQQPYSDGSQYGRWNGVNNNAFGLFPNQFGALFGYQPQGGGMAFQPPYANMSNQGINGGGAQGQASANPSLGAGGNAMNSGLGAGDYRANQGGDPMAIMNNLMSLGGGASQGQMPQLPSGQMPQIPSGQMPQIPQQSNMPQSAQSNFAGGLLSGGRLAAAAGLDAHDQALQANSQRGIGGGPMDDPMAFYKMVQAAAHGGSGGVLDPNFNGQVTNVPWDQLGNLRLQANPGGGPMSYSFTTPSTLGGNYGVTFVNTPGQQNQFRNATLSTQPGVFGTGPGGGGNVLASTFGAAPNLRFGVGGTSNAGYTALQPNTTYYLNLVNRNSYGGPDILGNNFGMNADFTGGGN